jgi:heme-degrading monooxygenase HmoA
VSFAVIYRWTLEPGQEEVFRQRWTKGTLRLRGAGGLGSCLTRNERGEFVAIALWPSEEARAAAFAASPPAEPQPWVLKFEEEKLWIEEDLWSVSPF